MTPSDRYGFRTVRLRSGGNLQQDCPENRDGALTFSPRSYGHSNHVCHESGEPDESGEVDRFLFVASRHSSTSFDSSKESFDLIAVPVDLFVVSFLHFACRVGFDADFCSELPAPLANGIRVICSISNNPLDLTTLELFEELFTLRSVATLTGCENKVDQFSSPARYGVQFCRQSSSTPAETATLVSLVFFSFVSRRPVDAV